MFISPMLLQSKEQPFEDQGFITELKLDGIRLILSKFDNQIKLFTRQKNNVSMKFPELLQLDIPSGTILDGEIIVTDQQGKPNFEAMLQRFQSNRSEHTIQYCVFDVIYHNGQKVTHLPLRKEKSCLKK
ncbi:hypothetical protein KY492_06345 [Brevibacterium sp. PAMC21349]|nr:hypothetical protein KY492_06345 [Brevibacterium sp. PAMC21349]